MALAAGARRERSRLEIACLAVALASCSAPRPMRTPVAPALVASTATAARPERRWRIAEGGDTVLEISDTPGLLVDSNAPPPPPGVTPRPHRFLSGGCVPGTVIACTRAGNELRASRSLDEFLGRLRDAGFSVQQVAP